MKSVSAFLLLFLFTCTVFAQDNHPEETAYEPYPELPFQLEHLMLNLTIEPSEALIKGIGRYEIKSRRDELNEVVLHTSDFEIQSITIGDRQLEYRVSGDSLIIQLEDTLGMGEKSQFHITWQSNSSYGIHTDANGHLWTSLQPKSNHHWFPVFDHPEVESTVEAFLTIPAEMEAVFNGKFIGDEILSTDEKKVQWKSEVPIPVTGISIAVGKFVKREAISGIKDISVFAGELILMKEVADGLLRIAVSSLKEIERNLSFEYPFEALNIVVLPDHKWDERQTGAGVIYLYQNLGSLATQLRRGIAEQWFGQHHRYLDETENAMNYEFLKASLLRNSDTEQLNNTDSLHSISAWNYWETGYENSSESFLKNTVEQSLPDLVKNFKGVTHWSDYADYWYQDTGFYWDSLSQEESSSDGTGENSVYSVEYIFDEANSTLQLIFEAEENPLETLAGVEVTEIGFSDTTTSEISFTGVQDTINVDISTSVEYVTLQPKDGSRVQLNEQKPFIFLINQLRSTDAENRTKAAKGLMKYSENPDLQLALRDILRGEEDSEVRAALLETLGVIIGGSSGTEQTFLAALRSDSEVVQIAAVKALSNYEGNEEVKYTVQNRAVQAESDTLFHTALKTYSQIANSGEMISLANRLENSDSTGVKSLKALRFAAKEDTTGRSFEAADRFLSERFPYSIRKEALDLLLNYQNNGEYWQTTLHSLSSDRDPRIRYL
ncbi:MAG: hypothetical protein WD597_09310, partial [Balneolaceae bacterium]